MNKDVQMLAEVYGLVHDKSLKVIPGKKVKFTDPETQKQITGTVSSRRPDQVRPGQKWEPTDFVITDLNGNNCIMPEHMLAII